MNVYATLPWEFHFNYSNVAVVDLTINSSLFDSCNLSSYSEEGIVDILAYHSISQQDIKNGVRFVAILILGQCTKTPAVSLSVRYFFL